MLDVLYTVMDQTWFTWGWPMSYLDVVILTINAFGIYLAARNTAWTAPVSIAGIITFVMSCYVSQFYSEYFLQIYFFIGNIWLLVAWSSTQPDGKKLAIKRASPQLLLYIYAVWVLGTWVLGSNIDLFFITCVRGSMALVSMFTDVDYVYLHRASAYPYLEAFSIVGQIITMVLMVRRYIANWYIWILIDIISVPLFMLKGGYGMAAAFGFFTLVSIYGAVKWNRIYKQEQEHPVAVV